MKLVRVKVNAEFLFGNFLMEGHRLDCDPERILRI
jgi:hypothetical protein